MIAQEERGNRSNLEGLLVQLMEEPFTECLYLDPAKLQHHHPPAPKFRSSQVKTLKNSESLCMLFDVDHHQKQE